MKTYTAKTVQVTIGLLPKFQKIVEQHHIFCDGEYYAVCSTLQEALETAEELNKREAEYQKQVFDSGLEEWEFIDQNTAG